MLIEPWFWRSVIFRESSKFDVRVWGYDYVWSGLCCWNHGLMSVWCCVIFAFQVSIQHPCIILGLLASYRLSSFSLVLHFCGCITVTLISMFLECPTTYGYGKSHCVVKEIVCVDHCCPGLDFNWDISFGSNSVFCFWMEPLDLSWDWLFGILKLPIVVIFTKNLELI